MCVYTHKAGRTPALQQNWQSTDKLPNSRKNTIFNEHPVPKSPKRIKDNAVKTLTIALNKNARKEKQVDP